MPVLVAIDGVVIFEAGESYDYLCLASGEA